MEETKEKLSRNQIALLRECMDEHVRVVAKISLTLKYNLLPQSRNQAELDMQRNKAFADAIRAALEVL